MQIQITVTDFFNGRTRKLPEEGNSDVAFPLPMTNDTAEAGRGGELSPVRRRSNITSDARNGIGVVFDDDDNVVVVVVTGMTNPLKKLLFLTLFFEVVSFDIIIIIFFLKK